MKTKTIVSILIGLLLVGAVGCEDTTVVNVVEPDVELSPSTEYKITDIVSGKSDVLNPQPGDLQSLQLEDLGFEVIVTTNTQIQVMRGSGSGYSNGNINDIRIGATVECWYYKEETDYKTAPVIIRATSIRAW